MANKQEEDMDAHIAVNFKIIQNYLENLVIFFICV
jgi:hypothetical protein